MALLDLGVVFAAVAAPLKNLSRDADALETAGADLTALQADLGQYCPTGVAACPSAGYAYAQTPLAYLAELEANVTALQATINGWAGASNGVQGVINSVDAFVCSMSCGFIAPYYELFHAAICTTLLGGLLQIGTALYVLGGMIVPIIILSAVMVVRLRGEVVVSEAKIYSEDGEAGQDGMGVQLM